MIGGYEGERDGQDRSGGPAAVPGRGQGDRRSRQVDDLPEDARWHLPQGLQGRWRLNPLERTRAASMGVGAAPHEGSRVSAEPSAFDEVAPLIVWTIYRNPSDFPGQFVVRAFAIGSGQVRATATHHVRDTLEAARSTLPAELMNLGRSVQDPPFIVETWV